MALITINSRNTHASSSLLQMAAVPYDKEQILRDLDEVFGNVPWMQELKNNPDLEFWDERELLDRMPEKQFFYRSCFGKDRILV